MTFPLNVGIALRHYVLVVIFLSPSKEKRSRIHLENGNDNHLLYKFPVRFS